MGGTISLPTYIVLDIPSPMAEKVQELRGRFDAERASLPAEITLTGSCGAGLMSMGQSLDDVLELVDRTASKFNPFKTTFDKVERFSNTDIYFLTFKNPERFLRVHKGFLESGIKFEASPYPFTPHCTLRLRKPPSEQELLELFFLPFGANF